ncbi:hypothetical protein JCM11251_002160 [Rhodosporidiobolus azoricus]
MDTESTPTLTTLPPELLLRILALLDPQSLARSAQVCTTLYAVAGSESLWRELVLLLLREHGVRGGTATGPPPSDEQQLDDGNSDKSSSPWRDAAKFLLPLSNQLGWFCSSKQFTSRLIRIAIHTTSPLGLFPPPNCPPPRYTIQASHVRPRNLFDPMPGSMRAVPPPFVRPFGAVIDPRTSSAYMISPNLNPSHPYAGLSVDVLEPAYDFDAGMFEVTPEEGAVLARAGTGNATQTREGIIAAAAANGILGGGGIPGAIPPIGLHRTGTSSAFRLRLVLDPVEQRVERGRGVSRLNSTGTAPLDDALSSSSDDEDGAGGGASFGRAATNRAALFALVSGRLPRTPWPTFPLVGLEEVPVSDLQGEGEEPSRGSVVRVSGGAFRGLSEHLTEREGERALARVEEGERQGREEAFVSGFRLRAKRTPRTSYTRAETVGRGAATPAAAPFTSTSSGTAGEAATPERRRGVGPNGGVAVLWSGAEEDPDERPHVTILRAGDEAEGGVVLRLPHSPEPADPPPLPNSISTTPVIPPSPSPDSALADAIDSSTESFFPIRAPAKSSTWDSPRALCEGGGIMASSIEGLWVGTYGAHGLEFVDIRIGFAEVPVSLTTAARGQTWAGLPSAINDIRAASRPRTRLQRLVTATKVTGDANVPSGQTSFMALLPSPELSSLPSLSVSPSSPASPNSPFSPLVDPSSLLDGPLPSMSLSRFNHHSSLDPTTPAYLARPPDWSEGLAERGWGRIALTGFTSPSWVAAEVRFLTEEVTVGRDGRSREPGSRSEEGDEQAERQETYERVEEIHLAWRELHKVAKFRRVRV